MFTPINVILEKCLVSIQRGEMTPAECLERNPEYREKLTMLLDTWEALQAAATVEPSSSFQRTAKTRLVKQLPDEQYIPFLQQMDRVWQTFLQPFKRRALRLSPIILAALFAFLATGAGVAYASEDALPGDTLYSAKTAIEGVRLAFADSDGDVQLFN